MNITIFQLLHIAFCAGFVCWLITIVGILHFFAISSKAQSSASQNTAVTSLTSTLQSSVRMATSFALIDLLMHILAWLFDLSEILGSSVLSSLSDFTILNFLGGVIGMIICIICTVICKSSTSSTTLLATARRLPSRMITIGIASIVIMTILSL